ncbi:nicotinate-nucleotide--dimethylbenzimidazole phosphoribosyltransferase [Nocardiopsis changdeensis]|uniref:Nicotinate-nucleotide--dimethylbenzimidazole phosphoribosyltransferase n=1 Tax=Nocardiopsis changdeensis TaxID=2831969 RepID=A0ABX8BTN6_9ACTN|nr:MULTISPECIES: nicotinate-nucleotide--dimethylbenzimidazole phosphoribosyltransferase [Nocardiopsis]QUX24186.1 nicotinate-nucleotide--dimethylbenzimidazole phosphoribosyltransferase [Nocardiopsis changdeensis]QYX34580.1 nicotinate-nucleotide--dimethylbenzimidazole phosphoribosyltransferase [Nocardiopsis sp. MT53]
MTEDDREDSRRGGAGGEDPRGRTAGTPGFGPLGGLLDGLPESGRGTRPRRPAGANPFRRPDPAPAARPERSPAAPPPPAPAAPPPEPEDRAEPAARAPEPEPPADPAPTPPARPNVIPFRNPPEPDPRAEHPPQDRTGADAPPERADHPAATAAGTPADTTPATTEAEQSMHVHEAAVPHAEPHPAQPPRPAAVRPAPEPASPAPAPAEPAAPAERTDHAYDEAERAAVYRAIHDRRDVRTGFLPDPVDHEVLARVLEAAHRAPSIGHSQPWDFVVIEDPGLRGRVLDLARRERDEYAHALPGTRARAFSGLKVEAVAEAPLNIAVTVDPARGLRHTPGRHARPMSASYAAALAVENLWLAARAEGLGVGWVGFADERDVARVLDLPSHLEVVAYLCLGHVEEFPTEPELGLSGRAKGRPLSWAVHHDRYGRRGLPGQEPTTLLEETIAAIGVLNTRAVEEARDRQDRMTKPPGSLGILEEVSVRLAGLAGECPPPIPEPAAVAVFAGDHGVHAQGVTAWPQEVTEQMVHNFLNGGAVVNAFAAQVGAEVTVVDVGVVGDLPHAAGLLSRKVARGTADITQGPAMTRDQAMQALESGIEVARDLVTAGNRCLVTGDMGIANTTPSAALICAFTGAAAEEATGRGTGVDDAMFDNKVDVVRRALAANPVDPADPIGTLAALGGFEHAALAGFILGGAAMRVPVLLDGVIAGSAALAAAAISGDSIGAYFAGHRSSEPGHALVLEHLGLRPLVDLEMRLGEGSGALLALPLLQGAARALRDVATFDDAGVSSAH